MSLRVDTGECQKILGYKKRVVFSDDCLHECDLWDANEANGTKARIHFTERFVASRLK